MTRQEYYFQLPQTQRNRKIAEAVDALLTEARNHAIGEALLTRRQARKAIQGRGGLLAALREKGVR
jgi:ribosomal protein S21